MKAAIYYGIGKVGIEERPIPKPGPKDVIVKNIRCGICGSDTTCYKFGPIAGLLEGEEFGHELAGIVSDVGSEVKDIPVGMRVTVNAMTAKGDSRLACRVGGFSQYTQILNAKIGYNIYELPDNVSFDEAALTEPLSVSTHGKNTPKAKAGDNLVVFGAGPIGLGVLAAALNKGIERPVVVDIDDHRLALAKEIGGTPFNSKSGDMKEFLTKHFGAIKIRKGETANVDIFVDAAGAPSVFEDYMKIVKPGGKLSQIAVPKDPVSLNLAQVMSTECVIMGSCGYTHDDICEVIDHLASKRTKITKIITHHFPLDQIAEAMKVAIDPAQAIKVIIDMD